MFDASTATVDQKKIVAAAVHLGWRVELVSEVVEDEGCDPAAIILFNTGTRKLPGGDIESAFWHYATALAVINDEGVVNFTQGHYRKGWSSGLVEFAGRTTELVGVGRCSN